MKPNYFKTFCAVFVIVFYGGTVLNAQSWSSGSGKLYTNPSSTMVGVGLSDPTSSVDVNGQLTLRRLNQNPHGVISPTHGLLRFVGNTSDYVISLQDGSGRVQHYWNSTTGNSPKYLVSNEEAGKLSFSPSSTSIFEIFHASRGSAGQNISWQSKLEVGRQFVGVMTSGPTETLDVNGSMRIRNISQDENLDRILVSNLDGKIFWRNASGLVPAGDNLGDHMVTQNLLPDTDNTRNLGSSTSSFGNIHFKSSISFGADDLLHLNGTENTFLGIRSGTVSSGDSNVGIGMDALSNASSDKNVAIGVRALQSNDGVHNSALGYEAMSSNVSGIFNVAIGSSSLFNNVTGGINTAIGATTLFNNLSGSGNTAIGKDALLANVSGSNNTGVGRFALRYNLTGNGNVAIGNGSGPNSSQTGLSNTVAIGNGSIVAVENGFILGSSQSLVGIRTDSPTHTFDVNGGVRFRLLPSTVQNHDLLVIDDSGIVFTKDASLIGGDNLGDHIATQHLVPNADNSWDLGNSNASFKDIYFNSALYFGSQELLHLDGTENTFIGIKSGFSTSGSNNVAVGLEALSNATSSKNVAIGVRSLRSNDGVHNSALGYETLFSNTSGIFNSAFGSSALLNNTTGGINTAMGATALYNNSSGSGNSAFGKDALINNTNGNNNTGIGKFALRYNVSGNGNTAIGNGSGPVSGQIALNNAVAIGESSSNTSSNQVRLGNSFTTDIGGQVSWSTLSDGRFKKNIKNDVHGLNFINSLRPVSYEVNKDKLNDHLGIPDSIQREMKSLVARSENNSSREIGFVAQEVVEAMEETGFRFNGVHVPENDQDHYTIRYAEFVVPLVKAVQELSEKVDEQQDLIEQQQILLNQFETSELLKDDADFTGKAILFQNKPNPFSLTTEIQMILPENVKQAEIFIYNLEGKQITSQNITSRGNTSASFGSGVIEPGMYLYALIVDGKVVDQKRMILTQ